MAKQDDWKTEAANLITYIADMLDQMDEYRYRLEDALCTNDEDTFIEIDKALGDR